MLFGRDFLRATYAWYIRAPQAFTLVGEMDRRFEGCCTVNRGSYYTIFFPNSLALARAVVRRPRILVSKMVWRRMLALLGERSSSGGDGDATEERAYLAYLA